MKYLIVGLGNPGDEYTNTRHNIGFKTLDFIAQKSSVFFSADRYAEYCNFKHRGRSVHMIKPTTFMNLSGKAVRYWKDSLKVDTDKLLIITDDIALDFGTIRVKSKGSDGGHNGLKDIQNILQTSKYPRLRFGVGNNFQRGKQSDYVLGKWTDQESNLLDERIEKCYQLVLDFTFQSISKIMSDYNNK